MASLFRPRAKGDPAPRLFDEVFRDTVLQIVGLINPLANGAIGDGIADDTAIIQGLIDAAPANGRTIELTGDHMTSGIRMDGTNGDKSNIALVGRNGGKLRLLPGAGFTNNVISIRSGSNFSIRNLMVEGNALRGGVRPPFVGVWKPINIYTYDAAAPDFYVSTAADGTVDSPAHVDGRVFKLLATHVSDATNILADVALGYWVEIVDGSVPNKYNQDFTFDSYHGIYVSGAAAAVQKVEIVDCVVGDAIYAGICAGSGPVRAGLIQFGCSQIKIAGNRIYGGSAGIGGAVRVRAIISNNDVQATGNIINVDQDGELNSIIGNTCRGPDTAYARNGVSSYKSSRVSVIGNTISRCQVGVNFTDNGGSPSENGAIEGNILRDISNTGISVHSAPYTSVVGNDVRTPTFNGIKLTSAQGSSVVGNVLAECGYYGIQAYNTFGVTITGNTVRYSGRSGIYCVGIRRSTISSNAVIDNFTGEDVANHPNGSGIYIIGDAVAGNSTELLIIANKSFDTGSPRKQMYGLFIGASQTGIGVFCNDFIGNKIGLLLNSGSLNPIAFYISAGSASLRTQVPLQPETDGATDFGAATKRWKDIYATNNVIQTSDARQKSDVADTRLGLEFVRALRPREFKRIDGDSGRLHHGFIAQELEESMGALDVSDMEFAGFIRSPVIELVPDEDWEPAFGDTEENRPLIEKETGEYTLGIREGQLIAPLVKAVQELTEKLERLERGSR